MPAKLDRCVRQVLQKYIDQYVEKHGKQPSGEEKKEFESRAWAICVEEGKERNWS